MRAFVVGLCGLAVLLPGMAAADIFHFTDNDGVVHYTNIQPSAPGWHRMYRTDDHGDRIGLRNVDRRPDPLRLSRYDEHIREAAQLYQLPEPFIRAIVQVESNFFPDAISEDGAMGLMQLMPETALHMGVLDAFDPRQNVLGGTRYLRVLANRFNGDLVLTVAAYNAGENAVDRYRGVPPYAETRRYVRNVLHHYYAFRSLNQLAQN
ncbi:MAG TPA: lytic transglycosylase domain-containing protein [Polyangiales bacterium]|jgi:soluble lytic murein transglycosylase-like protein|nr:lytic transglycosylase domain-containing protein [Polyangiales bacterium]